VFADRIDDFWHEDRFTSRSEAIRWLIQAALDKKLKPGKAAAKENERPKCNMLKLPI
jgi:Arc/MetJ-type ribon-helix-helix transcriptional regulator